MRYQSDIQAGMAGSVQPGLAAAEGMGEVTEISGITRKARWYALKELARRAGVSAEFFHSWRIEFGENETTVYTEPGTEKRIRFKNAPSNFWRELSAGIFHTARASWMHPIPGSLATLIPDFVIPFAHKAGNSTIPLFTQLGRDCVDCDFDLLVSVLLSLSRWEELRPGDRDMDGRFTALMSLAFRDGFLKRPVVDELGLALEQVLTHLLPGWQPLERRLRVKLSHDVDHVGLPLDLRSAIVHTLRRRKPLATSRDLVGWFPGLNPAYLELVRRIAQFSLERALDSAVYWKASPRGPRDSGYDPRHVKVRRMVAWLHQRRVETGVHPGYETYLRPDRLLEEVRVLREVLGEQPLGGRQHHLRWCPDTWRHWEDCGLAYDSSVGYADHVGFRAGTCIPYRPWLFSLGREANLIEIPLIVMDRTLVDYMGLTPQESLSAVLDCKTRCATVGGVFTLLWHNTSLIDPMFDERLYLNILDMLAGHEGFEWRTPSDTLY